MEASARSKGQIAIDLIRGDCSITALSVCLAAFGYSHSAIAQSAVPAMNGLHGSATMSAHQRAREPKPAGTSATAVESSQSLIHLVATKPGPKRRCVWVIDGRWKVLRDGRSPLVLSLKVTHYGPEPDHYSVKGTATDTRDGRVGKLWGNGTDRVFYFKYTWRDDQNPFTHPADSYEGVIASDGSVSGTARIDQYRGAQWDNSRGLKMNPVALERWRRDGSLHCKPPVSNAAAIGATEDGGIAGAASAPPSRLRGATQQPSGFAR